MCIETPPWLAEGEERERRGRNVGTRENSESGRLCEITYAAERNRQREKGRVNK